MKRNELVQRLIKEGFSEKTLVNFSDKQLSDLSERVLGEQPIKTQNVPVTTIDTSTEAGKKAAEELLNNPNPPKGHYKVAEEKGKLSKNQSNKMDTDKDGDIDGKDLKNLRKGNKKVEAKEGKDNKPTEKQLKSLDKNKNNKIDSEDFKLLRKGKKNVEVKEGIFNKKYKKVDTIKHGGHEMDVWSDGKDKLIGHPKKEGTKSSAETQNSEKLLGYGEEKLDKLKKSIDDINSGKKNVSFPLHKKKFDNPKFKETKVDINESVRVKKWVNKLVESNYHSFTSKSEIMELIQSKMTQHEVGPNVNKGHNDIPEFMSYDSISSSEVTESGTKTKPKTKPSTAPSTPKPKKPYKPGPGKNPKPKALKEDK